MLKKVMIKFSLVLMFLTTAAVSNADRIVMEGRVDHSTGLFATIIPVSSLFSGELEYLDNHTFAALLEFVSFCFASDAVGFPSPTSQKCQSDRIVVPILPGNRLHYDGEPHPPATMFDRDGSTFDGEEGVVKLLAYSPTFFINMEIEMNFHIGNTGTITVDGGWTGTVSGPFVWERKES
jgi:hypothetical protein